jgi:hypothetical protein
MSKLNEVWYRTCWNLERRIISGLLMFFSFKDIQNEKQVNKLGLSSAKLRLSCAW